MASHLARTVQARLILIGRTPLPERSAWNHHLSTDSRHARTIGAILEMERNGAEVLNVAADVADARAMRSAIQAAFSRFGLVDGVIHAAGVTASERIPFKTAATMHSVLAPKVVGTMVLEEILRDQPLDFFLLMSSLSSITGTGPGQLDYCSGNAFLDAFARAEAKANRRIVAVNWCEWQWDASEGKMSEYSSDLHRMMRQYRDKMGITFEEGMNAWVRILASGFDQVAVSTQPLEKIQESRLSFNATRLGDAAAEEAISQYQHPRPELEVAFEAPGNEIETKLTEIWEELLHLGPVGIHDDFFDLGGHSLLATQLFSRISRTLEVDLSVSDIFDVPTVALQAEMISAVLWSRPQQASISTAAGVVAGEI
jgi:NADP-dependent 3-hydroxy acid dehydrogenase YdfG